MPICDLVPGFFNIYGETLNRIASGILQYLCCYVVPIWVWDPSVLIVIRWADLGPGFFGTYSGTLGRSGSVILWYLYCYTMPIQFLDSLVLILLHYANLVSGLFGAYAATLCQFSFLTLRYLYCCTMPTWYIVFDALGPGWTPCLLSAFIPCPGCLSVGWKRQPEEGGIGPGCCGGGVITTWAAGDGVIAAGSAV